MRSLLLAVLLLASSACDQPSPRHHPAVVERVDLNAATVKQLEALPAIGSARAHSIIASRNARGGHFRSVDDLLQIDGVGPKTLEAIRPYVYVTP